MTVPISNDQAAQLQAKVTKLLGDKQTADAATSASNDAQSKLLAAQQAASDAQTAEAQADGQVNVDIADLLAFVQSLTGTPVVVPAPAPAPSPAPAPAAT